MSPVPMLPVKPPPPTESEIRSFADDEEGSSTRAVHPPLTLRAGQTLYAVFINHYSFQYNGQTVPFKNRVEFLTLFEAFCGAQRRDDGNWYVPMVKRPYEVDITVGSRTVRKDLAFFPLAEGMMSYLSGDASAALSDAVDGLERVKSEREIPDQ